MKTHFAPTRVNLYGLRARVLRRFATKVILMALFLTFIQTWPAKLTAQFSSSMNLDGVVSHPNCWNDSPGICEEKKYFAPDSVFPQHTPIRYVKIVLHIFQKTAPNDPGNWQDIPQHLDIMKSWFNDPLYGPNQQLANLCDPLPKVPGQWTPHIPDSRVRMLFEGVTNEDVFFWKDDSFWGTGYGCGVNGPLQDGTNTAGNIWVGNQITAMGTTYVNRLNNPTDPLYSPDAFNAVHVFLTGATDPPNDLAVTCNPDCVWYCSSGATFMTAQNACGNGPKFWFQSQQFFKF